MPDDLYWVWEVQWSGPCFLMQEGYVVLVRIHGDQAFKFRVGSTLVEDVFQDW